MKTIKRATAGVLMGLRQPELDIGTLLSLVGGMLGLGWFRTTEKIKGVAKP